MTTKIYFSFVFDYPQASDNTTRWMPNMNLFEKYPHLEGIVKMECDIVGDDKTKEFAPWKKWGYRLWSLEADDETLANFGTSVSDILAKGKVALSQYEIATLSDDEVIAYLRKWTTLEEVSSGKFLISPEGEYMGEKVDAVYLTIV